LTVTVKLQDSGSPELFVVPQFTAVVPIGKLDPDGGLQAAAGAAQLSGKVGAAYATTAEPIPGELSVTFTLAGQVIVAPVS
jgi:hypothetical protein